MVHTVLASLVITIILGIFIETFKVMFDKGEQNTGDDKNGEE